MVAVPVAMVVKVVAAVAVEVIHLVLLPWVLRLPSLLQTRLLLLVLPLRLLVSLLVSRQLVLLLQLPKKS